MALAEDAVRASDRGAARASRAMSDATPGAAPPRVDGWSVTTDGADGGCTVQGWIYGDPDPKHADGNWYTSSSLRWVCETRGIAQTHNRIIQLGTRSRAFDRWCAEEAAAGRRPFKPYRFSAAEALHSEVERAPDRERLNDLDEDASDDEAWEAGAGVDRAMRYLSDADQRDLAPGIPMSEVSDAQRAGWERRVRALAAQRKQEQRAERVGWELPACHDDV